jgi:hypothetical protein
MRAAHLTHERGSVEGERDDEARADQEGTRSSHARRRASRASRRACGK